LPEEVALLGVASPARTFAEPVQSAPCGGKGSFEQPETDNAVAQKTSGRTRASFSARACGEHRRPARFETLGEFSEISGTRVPLQKSRFIYRTLARSWKRR
jgi:hypothetical protein